MRLRLALLSGAFLVTFFAGRAALQQPASPPADDWPMYRRDSAGTGHSPLRDIDAGNVSRLTQAWTYSLAAASTGAAPGRGGAPAGGRGGAGGTVNSEATPIVVNGVMYVPGANRVVALEPESGREIWQAAVSGGAPSRRGVAYWPGAGDAGPRIIFTAGRRLIAVEARSGAPAQGFGTDGEIDLGVPYNSVPFVHGNVIVVGANNPPGTPGAIGDPRAYDARTGAKLWQFHAVAQPGETGHDTWEGDSWRNRLGVNAWPFYFTMDEARGLLYVPLASPIPDDYGGDRKGANLFGNSVVAVDINTGAYRWHFQTIHHDIWDADPPAPPSLFDIVRGGATIPALALTTKSGYMYILNRENGQPVFGVEERAVPKSDVPGEATYPTQPFPVKPPPIARTAFTQNDLVTAADTTPEHAAACKALVEEHGISNLGPFTPWAYRAEGSPPRTSLVFPGGLGGANWGGTAYDPASRYVLTATQDAGAIGYVEAARPGRSGEPPAAPFAKATPPHDGGRGVFDARVNGVALPCQRPPWGQLIAIDTSTGDVAWHVPLGITEQLPPDKQRTGRPVLAGPIVTASGLVFIASTDDNRFRALDVRTGRELWTSTLARRGNADPITYRAKNGKQYVAVVATDAVVAFALP
jgi:quinoprotein glucose dehydrogenase